MDDLEAVREIVKILEEFDQDEKTRIVRWSLEKAGLTMPAATPDSHSASSAQEGRTGTPSHQAHGGSSDIRTFVTSKNPSSDNQFAAVVGYYYAFEANPNESKKVITSADLIDACRKVGRARLGDPIKTLSNAHGMGYFDKAGRGEYQLNTVGENLVAMTLPAGAGDNQRVQRKAVRKKNVAKKVVRKKAKR